MFFVYSAIGVGAVALLLVILLVAHRGRSRVQVRPVTAEDTLRVMEVTVAPGSDERPYAGLAGMIHKAQDEQALRRFACACAAYAVKDASLTDKAVLDALKIGESLADQGSAPKGLEQTRRVVNDIADQFDTQDTEDAPNKAAFDKARAAQAVLACLGDDAKTAAAEACYEVLTATDDVDAITRIADETLR